MSKGVISYKLLVIAVNSCFFDFEVMDSSLQKKKKKEYGYKTDLLLMLWRESSRTESFLFLVSSRRMTPLNRSLVTF